MVIEHHGIPLEGLETCGTLDKCLRTFGLEHSPIPLCTIVVQRIEVYFVFYIDVRIELVKEHEDENHIIDEIMYLN